MFGSGGSDSLGPRAEADLEEIWLYTRDRWWLEQAELYLRAMTEAFACLASGSRVGRVSNVRNGYLEYAVGPHLIFYI